MNDDELIARQARQIAELEEENEDLTSRIEKAMLHIYCVSGPLNDNKLGYSKEQLVTFQNIADELAE